MVSTGPSCCPGDTQAILTWPTDSVKRVLTRLSKSPGASGRLVDGIFVR
jgi:hypothetical protein